VEQLRDSALLDHNLKGETGWWDGCISAFVLERLQPHFPFQDDNGLPTHNPWLVLVIFIVSCSSQAEWIDTSVSCDMCRCALDYLIDIASRLSMHERQSRALGHGWDSVLHGVTIVVAHRQLLDHLASIRLQYPCRMHYNTHQTASWCRVEPTQVLWWGASSMWGMPLHIADSIWTWHPFLRAWSTAWWSWRSLGWIGDNVPLIQGSYGFTLPILETSNQEPLESCLGQLQYPQLKWHAQERELSLARKHTCWIWHGVDGHKVIVE
jgi:hypothetical protein